MRREVFQKTSSDLIQSEDGIRLLEEIDASTDTDQLCNLHHHLAHAERRLARSQRRVKPRINVKVEPGVASTPPAADSITFTLGESAGLSAEQVEDAIRQHLDQRYHRFVSQAVNNMEFGRGKSASSLAGVLHSSSGIPGVGSCCVFYSIDEKRPGEILILGIGHHVGRTTYRLAYASEKLGVSGNKVRIS